jgi:hypothetical protein
MLVQRLGVIAIFLILIYSLYQKKKKKKERNYEFLKQRNGYAPNSSEHR